MTDKIKTLYYKINSEMLPPSSVKSGASRPSTVFNNLLLKIELPKFKGNLTRWRVSFRDTFNSLVNYNNVIGDIEHFY